MRTTVTTPAIRLLNSQAMFWCVLAIPAWPLVVDLFQRERYYAEIMYESGVWSVQLMILALAITPAMKLTNGARSVRWLLIRRRAIGVASFGYAAMHTFFYCREKASFELVLLELEDLYLLTGWLSFVVLTALAITSNNRSMKAMAAGWKLLQRSAYAACAFALLHWYLVDQFLETLYWWTASLAVLQLVRLAWASRKTGSVRLNSSEPRSNISRSA